MRKRLCRNEVNMKQIMVLTKAQLGSAVDFLRLSRKSNKQDRKKKVNTISILVVAFVFFSLLFGFYVFGIGIALQESGYLYILPGMMMMVACIMNLITTVVKVKSTLFGFKDYDIVMSLPVSTSKVVASRLVLLYILNFFFTLVVMLPTTIVYGILSGAEVLFYLFSLIALLFIPLVPLVLSGLIGTCLAAITAKFRKSNLFNTLLIVLFFIVVFVLYFQIISNPEQLLSVGIMMESMMRKIYPISILFLNGVVEGNVVSLLSFLLISVALFGLFSAVVGHFFVRLSSSIASVHTKSNYKFQGQEVSSPFRALFRKEFRRYVGCSAYLLNSSVGILLATVASIALLIFRPAQLELFHSIPGMEGMLPYVGIAGLTFMIGLVVTSACSLSLEGKNFWIIRSAPIAAKTVFQVKFFLNIVIVLPFLIINVVILSFLLKAGLVESILMFAVPFAYNYFISIFGLWMNIKHPVFDWTSEIVVVKQGASVLITTFSSMGLVIVPIVVLAVTGLSPFVICCMTAGILILAATMMKLRLDKDAEKIMAKLCNE